MEEKPRQKTQWFKIIGTIAFTVFAISACNHFANSGPSSSTDSLSNTVANAVSASVNNAISASDNTTESSQPAQPPAKMGEAVTIDKFVVKVNSMKYLTKIPDNEFAKAPSANGGKWLIVNVTVKNDDSTARTIDTSLFKLVSGDKTYDASDEADPWVNNNNSFFFTSINPELSLTGNIAFNIPSNDNYQLKVLSGFMSKSTQLFNLTK